MKKEEDIVLKKGESIIFLDYQIKNSLNNDGLVLSIKEGSKSHRYTYQSHLGNYGTGTQKNIDACKRYAILYFMLARPEIFASSIAYKLMGSGGSYHEYFLLSHALKDEGLDMPPEITCGDGMNCMIYFQNKPIFSKAYGFEEVLNF